MREKEKEDLFQAIGHSVLILTPDHTIVDANKATVEAVGVSREKLRGKKCYEVFHRTKKPAEGCPMKKLLKSKSLETEDMEVEALAGTYLVSCTPVVDENGDLEKILHIATDITERKQMKEKLRKAKQEKTAILNSMSEHVVYQDMQNRILWTNRAAGESVGRTPEQLVGRYCYEIWPQRNDPCPNCPVIKARETGQPQKAKVTAPDGRDWIIRGYPFRDANGGIVGVVEVTLEITGRKRAEKQKERAKEEAEFYADVLAHDIGNINQVMMGYLFLLEHTENAETREENIRNMKKSIRKCKRLAENIQILKKINKEPQKTLKISTCIKKAANNLKEDFDQEIKLNFDISSEIHVTANSFLDEAFFNILENAVEYTVQEPVQIDISIEEKDSMCEVCICDYGLGISEEKRKDLLENLETLSKRTGMGIFLSKRIVESSNGTMDIVSREKGTEVVITLPIEEKNSTVS